MRELLILAILVNLNCYDGFHHLPPTDIRERNAWDYVVNKGLHPGSLTQVPVPCLNDFAVYKINVHEGRIDAEYTSHFYIAVSKAGYLLPLDSAVDLNHLLEMEDVRLESDSTAWNIVQLLFKINNRVPLRSKKFIVTTADNIPRHTTRLKKTGVHESNELRQCLEISNPPENVHTSFMRWIEFHDSVYVSKTVNINDIIYPPSLLREGDDFVVTFFTWQTGGGAIKKWSVYLNQIKYVAGYTVITIAMWIGAIDIKVNFSSDFFDYKWGEIAP